MKCPRWQALAIGLALALISLFSHRHSLEASSLTFTHGVASGDVTHFSAVLWTRVNARETLTVEVSTDPGFQQRVLKRAVLASAANDFTAKVIAAPLRPNQRYFYRWRHGDSVSEVGTFRTAPPPRISADLRFAYSGDSDGTRKANGMPAFNNFEALDAARLEGLDFFVYLGDTIYSDSVFRPSAAQTLEEYRDAYKENREIAALRNILRETSIYAIWDDHEVHDDFDGQTVDPDRYAAGREAFLEYMPLVKLPLHDPSCAGTPLFRVFRWGKDVDIIILDERSCRSADVELACSGAPGLPDLAPTLPGPLRAAFPDFLPPSPPPGCLAAIFDPTRTMLGARQKGLLKLALLQSRAKFKFVINEVPIQQFYVIPYDRWEGYAAERAEILNFIRDHDIENVIFLTTDTHTNQINEVFIDRFLDSDPIAQEFVTGPIATFTLEQSILNIFGPLAPQVVAAVQQILTLVGADCRHLDKFSYGLVEVNASAGTATITLKDDAGIVISDQLDSSIQCTKTIGP